MVEPVRQWAALDLGLDPGEPLTDVLFPNFVAANKESRAIVAMYRDPGELAERRDRSSRPSKSWDRISRRNSARCALGAAEAARRSGDTDRAITILRILERELLACGRRPLLRRVHATLRLLGESVRPHSGTALPPLTAAQVEVLDLVGRGLDTRAIARRLVVSEATVETHVRQSMQRLGVPTRLAAAVELVRRRGDVATGANGAISTSQWARSNRSTSRRRRSTSSDLPVAPWTLRSHDGREPGGAQPTTTSRARGHRRVARRLARGRDRRRRCPQDARAELLDALARIGPVRTLGTATPTIDIETDEVMRDALEVLANGGTVVEAAYAVHMSERTLHRTLVDACASSSASAATRSPRAQVLGCARLTAAVDGACSDRLEHHHVDRPVRDARLVRGVPGVDLGGPRAGSSGAPARGPPRVRSRATDSSWYRTSASGCLRRL